MYYDPYTTNEAAKLEMERIERRARDGWRFRNFKSKPARVIQAALSSLLGVLIH